MHAPQPSDHLTAGIAVLATLFVLFGPRTYSAESVVRFDFANSAAAGAPRLSLDAAAVVDSEARIARSRIVAEKVVSRHEVGAPVFTIVLTNVRLQRLVHAPTQDRSYHLARYGRFYASVSS